MNHALKRSSFFVIHAFFSSGRCGSAQYAESIGSSENETKSDTATAQAMVSANGLNHWPETPDMNAMGTNTARIDSVVAVTARPISSVPSRAAVKWSLPISRWRTMFSRTTMASSIRMPIASDRPSSDMVLSVKPATHTAMNDASTDTGSARPVMTVERQELRKRNTTSTVRMAPSINASCTLRTAASTRTPASRTTSMVVPAGRVSWIALTSSRISALTEVVL